MAAFPALLGLLMAASVTGEIVDITPTEAVQKVGSDLEVICRVNYAIDSCRMIVGGITYRLKPEERAGDVVYAGAGIENKECGAHIKNIKEELNGNVTCVLPPQSGNIEVSGTMRLIVAKAPQEPRLLTPPQPAFTEGEVFAAQCLAEGGRPAARLSWFIDHADGEFVPLLEGLHQAVTTPLPGSDLVTISQNVSRTLEADDGGRTLLCRVEHAALPRPFEVKRQLIVNYPPKRSETGPLTIFGLKLNEPGRLNVTVRANPRPQAEWNTGEHRLVPPQSVQDEAITYLALEPLNMGGGYYNISLVLSPVTKEAVERTYYLRVSNELGNEEIAVRVSTMDEPAGPPSSTGVELETGAIVGIVIAVLLILIAGSLVVFAYATDRWCFAGRRRDNAKSSGESTPAGAVLLDSGNPLPPRHSDTESAVGGKERSRLAALGARVRAALPRHKDKVQAVEAQPEPHEEKEPEDKVVYAQLALSEQTTADKPPPPSTEYAEIVYTEQGQKEAKE